VRPSPGRPVRGQGVRHEGHRWDPKGPTSIHRTRAALDPDGAVLGNVFESEDFSRVDIDTNESDPAYSLCGQLMGLPLKPLEGFGVPAESCGFANKRLVFDQRPARNRDGLSTRPPGGFTIYSWCEVYAPA
jgi:nicotinate dehydrogenase subunit B